MTALRTIIYVLQIVREVIELIVCGLLALLCFFALGFGADIVAFYYLVGAVGYAVVTLILTIVFAVGVIMERSWGRVLAVIGGVLSLLFDLWAMNESFGEFRRSNWEFKPPYSLTDGSAMMCVALAFTLMALVNVGIILYWLLPSGKTSLKS